VQVATLASIYTPGFAAGFDAKPVVLVYDYVDSKVLMLARM